MINVLLCFRTIHVYKFFFFFNTRVLPMDASYQFNHSGSRRFPVEHSVLLPRWELITEAIRSLAPNHNLWFFSADAITVSDRQQEFNNRHALRKQIQLWVGIENSARQVKLSPISGKFLALFSQDSFTGVFPTRGYFVWAPVVGSGNLGSMRSPAKRYCPGEN